MNSYVHHIRCKSVVNLKCKIAIIILVVKPSSHTESLNLFEESNILNVFKWFVLGKNLKNCHKQISTKKKQHRKEKQLIKKGRKREKGVVIYR